MDIQDAIAAANNWVQIANPVIKAMLELDAIRDRLLAHDGDEVEYAVDPVHKAKVALFNQLDGIRDNILCNYRRACLVEMTAAEIEAVDTFNDELDDAVVSVSDAIKMVERQS